MLLTLKLLPGLFHADGNLSSEDVDEAAEGGMEGMMGVLGVLSDAL